MNRWLRVPVSAIRDQSDEPPSRRPGGVVSSRELPARPAVRGWISVGRYSTDHVLIALLVRASGAVCFLSRFLVKNLVRSQLSWEEE